MRKNTKPTIILVHGLRGDHHGLLEVANFLREQKIEVFTPDLPGYGDEESLKEQTPDSYADWLKSYIDSLNLQTKPVVIGHSMGSIVVSAFVKKYPKDCDERVVFMAPILRTEGGQKRSNITSNIFSFLLGILSGRRRYLIMKSKLVSFCISRFLTYDRTRQKYIDLQHFMHSGNFNSTTALIGDIRLSMREQVALTKEKEYLFCMGDYDHLTKVSTVANRICGYENITLEIIPHVGHLLNYEQPRLVAEAIEDYLA